MEVFDRDSVDGLDGFRRIFIITGGNSSQLWRRPSGIVGGKALGTIVLELTVRSG